MYPHPCRKVLKPFEISIYINMYLYLFKYTVSILPCWAPSAECFMCESHPCACMFPFLVVNDLDIWCSKVPTMKSLPSLTVRSWRCSSMLFSRGFVVLNFIFRSTIHIELIFCVQYELWVISFSWYPIDLVPFMEKTLLCNITITLKSSAHIFMSSFLVFFPLFHYDIFKHTEKLKALFIKYPYTHLLDSTSNIFLWLHSHILIQLSSPLVIYKFIFFKHFKVIAISVVYP